MKQRLIQNETIAELSIENTRVLVENCKIKRLYCLNCQVIVRNCYGQNVGFNFVQLDKCWSSLIEGNIVRNTQGKTAVEDNISLFECENVIVRGNYVEGATPHDKYSGSGIMVDKGCTSCTVTNNVVINTQNVGIGIAGGTNNLVTRNRVFSAGPGCNGNVGVYIANQYPDDDFSGNAGTRNVIGWITPAGRNDWWLDKTAIWKRNSHAKRVSTETEYDRYLRIKNGK